MAFYLHRILKHFRVWLLPLHFKITAVLCLVQVLALVYLGHGDIVELARLPRQVEGLAVGVFEAGKTALHGRLGLGDRDSVVQEAVASDVASIIKAGS